VAHSVVLIRGDGIGPEIAEVTRRVLDASGVAIDWDVVDAGAAVMEKEGTPLPEAVLATIRAKKVALKAPIATPVGTGFRSVNVALRQELELYACVRPCRTLPGIKTPFKDIDLVIVRENTEDLYAGIEFQRGKPETHELVQFIKSKQPKAALSGDVGISIKPISVEGTRRIVRFAFEYARAHGRRKVTAVHKANIMKFSDGLFLEVAHDVAKEYLDVEFSARIVDDMCMQLVKYPAQYDVLVLPNLYGDIISDLAAGMIGGLGVAPGANIGEKGAVFEATHGTAPDIAGQNKANPVALILSGVMMLHHLGEHEAARRVHAAVLGVLDEGTNVTADLREDPRAPGAVGTREMGQAIIDRLGRA
jgi:isocitrate dehydrogenase (NAD+)